jgi:hypothetical protein
MGYLTQSVIAENFAMRQRVAQCAASEGIRDVDSWTHENRREWAAAPGWDAAWESALVDAEPEYDPGADQAVITDGQILSQVQAMAPTSLPDRSHYRKADHGDPDR